MGIVSCVEYCNAETLAAPTSAALRDTAPGFMLSPCVLVDIPNGPGPKRRIASQPNVLRTSCCRALWIEPTHPPLNFRACASISSSCFAAVARPSGSATWGFTPTACAYMMTFTGVLLKFRVQACAHKVDAADAHHRSGGGRIHWISEYGTLATVGRVRSPRAFLDQRISWSHHRHTTLLYNASHEPVRPPAVRLASKGPV